MASHFPSLATPGLGGTNSYLFSRDISAGIMPYRNRGSSGWEARLVGDETNAKKARWVLEDIGRSSEYSLKELVASAVTSLAENLAHTGVAYFEMAKLDESFQLHCFTSKRLIRLPGWMIQIVPKADQGLWERRLSIARTDSIWRVKMPGRLGGVTRFKWLLWQLDNSFDTAPDFWREDMERGVQTQNFDYSEYRKNSEIALMRKARRWGWARLGDDLSSATEYYYFHKKLDFFRAQAILRKHLIKELNVLFNRLGLECQLEVSGLPLPFTVSWVQERLSRGEISFLAASKQASCMY